MKKEYVCCLVIGVVLTGFLYCQETPFEGKWSVKLPMALFFDTVEYTFRGNTWTETKLRNGRAAEISEGTFTFTRDRIIMQQHRWKTTGDDWEEMEMSTGGNYTLSGNKLSIDRLEFTRIADGGNSRTSAAPDTGRVGGLYYSLVLPKGWAGTNSHKYLSLLGNELEMDSAKGDVAIKAFVDQNNENNFLLISEIAVVPGYTTARMMSGTPAKRTMINGKEFYIMTKPFGALNTVKAAYIVYKDILHYFFFTLENSSLNAADQVLASIQLK